ncbi:MAG: hypothetical protein J3T61_06410 [Candidatus Brocadiales bacterium]|nr:hypothetical protein [Candidatus Bathyanammoxibius sp.]
MCLIESRAGWRKEGIGKGEDGAVSSSTEEAEPVVGAVELAAEGGRGVPGRYLYSSQR